MPVVIDIGKPKEGNHVDTRFCNSKGATEIIKAKK
jgi:hypothetical protein